ncbi:MAG: hypothetical protein NTV36_00210, partial [Candidatus Staskawiczbacteria bacterium]|nr:hypothetical protein [Candidatus Staskawiczbacteria bacterium]
KYQSEWWDNFIKWAFIGVFGSFFIFIAAQMMEKMKDPKDLDLIVVMVFLYVGLKITKKSSAMGAAAVMGLAGKALGYAGVGAGIAGMGGSKVLDKLTGNRASEAAQKVKSGAGRAMERLGLRNTGTTASANNKKVSEKASLMEKEYTAAKATGDTATIERIQKQAKVGRGVDGAAAYKVVSDAKDIHKAFADPTAKGGVNLEAAAQRAKYAEATGATGIIKDSEKAMPGIAGHNEISINGIVDEWAGKKDSKTGIRTGGKLNPANGLPWTEADAKAAAPREAIRRRNAGMTMQEMRGMPAPQMDANHIEDSNVGTFRRAALEYDTDHKDKALALLEERGEGSIRDKRNIAYGADPTVHTTAAARQTHYDANLSGEALVNKHNSMTAAQINTWATTLTPAQEQEYVNANGQAESAKIYKQIEIAKNAAATATHGGNMKKGDDLSNKMNIIAELKD